MYGNVEIIYMAIMHYPSQDYGRMDSKGRYLIKNSQKEFLVYTYDWELFGVEEPKRRDVQTKFQFNQ